MIDRISPSHRSWNMSRIRDKNTAPERIVRSVLHRLGYRFRLHRSDLPGKPDIVLPRHRAVILVHGCFWHRHKGCKEATTPKTRTVFWLEKFAANVKRDSKNQRKLRRMDWKVMTVWQCQTVDTEKLSRRFNRFLAQQ